ncbi:thermonuclease family protein [Rhizobium tubonense]|uniref:Nuclease n=1 Tax=Rhizobium tubonense TaxID=484088 RepID=A0A2W4CY64_9HYPH|nr:thermonuclease family protein [Rhizobium tubonense]PZM15708.1 nuclease [Rhizobium tubonense]
MRKRVVLALAVLTWLPIQSKAADYIRETPAAPQDFSPRSVLSGQVAVIYGRSLWFGKRRTLVRLAGIDSCELPQWALDPKVTAAEPLAPLACGALAKAWLKRVVGSKVVSCSISAFDNPNEGTGICRVGSRDLALEMLRVGWAKLSAPFPSDQLYVEAQQNAIAARYGMWATYVLDMEEWRRRAIDKTLARTPQADLNLLSRRQSEISPPFADARRQPVWRDQ